MSPIRILLADDHKIVRDGLCSLIEHQPDMEVVGEAQNGRETIELVDELMPDVVLMDVGMPDLNGIEATRQITNNHAAVKVVGLSMHSDGQFVTEMLEAGASGYLLKDSAFEELSTALHEVVGDRMYLSPKIAGPAIDEYQRRLAGGASGDSSPLSPREREVLQLLAEGLVSKQIAARLNISVKTIETHRSRLMKKLGIHSVAELTKYAIRQGLTPLED
ncbi:MAG: response regulator transcription factor [Candidatus Brocadiia bacterium]